jgi:hypothetical protein
MNLYIKQKNWKFITWTKAKKRKIDEKKRHCERMYENKWNLFFSRVYVCFFMILLNLIIINNVLLKDEFKIKMKIYFYNAKTCNFRNSLIVLIITNYLNYWSMLINEIKTHDYFIKKKYISIFIHLIRLLRIVCCQA